MDDSPNSIARDVATIGAIASIAPMLRIICDSTGMGFAAVARVTEGTWTACAVQDNIAFGLKAGGQLPVNTTLCIEARAAREPVVFDHASTDPRYKDHHTPRLYNIESYISVPIVLPDGEYFGNLCAIDPQPRPVSKVETVAMFKSFAELIAAQLEQEHQSQHVASELFDARNESKLRERFTAVLGHDLRSPLATVALTADSLIQLAQNEKAVTAGKRLRSAAARMTRLVDDVLDLARGNAGGGLSVALAPCESLQESIEEMIEELRAAYPGRTIHSRVTIGRAVTCDPLRVQQLVSNLVGNALGHAAPGQPIVVSADLNAGGDRLEIAVLHEGTPIPEALQDRGFDTAWLSDAEAAGQSLGLGLFISEQIARAHGGRIRVNSSAEGETLFVAELKV